MRARWLQNIDAAVTIAANYASQCLTLFFYPCEYISVCVCCEHKIQKCVNQINNESIFERLARGWVRCGGICVNHNNNKHDERKKSIARTAYNNVRSTNSTLSAIESRLVLLCLSIYYVQTAAVIKTSKKKIQAFKSRVHSRGRATRYVSARNSMASG